MRISIVSAVYNNAGVVRHCVDSVLSQSGVTLDYVVVDGGSTDGTLDVLAQYKAKIGTLISERDEGVYYALNKGIALASGDVIGLLHADDSYAGADVLAKVERFFGETDADAVYGDLAYLRSSGGPLRYWRAGECSEAAIRRGWMPPHPALFVKKDIYRKFGGFDTSYRIAADYELILRFFYAHKIRAVYLPELLVNMRVGGMSNRSLSNILLKSREDYQIMKKHGVGGVGTLLMKNFSKLPQFFRRPE